MTELPKVGESVKVRLPGETPWAICVEVRENCWMGCIINRLFREYSEFEQAKWPNQEWGKGFVKLPELHKYKKYDVLEFIWPEGNMPYGSRSRQWSRRMPLPTRN
jgi:hypothetical protein